MCCKDKCTCEQKPDPKECTPEQILECHGQVDEHPCLQQCEQEDE